MSKDYYFLFSPDDMPLGVFITETPEESQELFCKLYRRSWDDMAKVGIYMKKEQDVPADMWEEIHIKYQRRKQKETKPLPPPVIKIEEAKEKFKLKNEDRGSMSLECEKYLTRRY